MSLTTERWKSASFSALRRQSQRRLDEKLSTAGVEVVLGSRIALGDRTLNGATFRTFMSPPSWPVRKVNRISI
ncbi:unnamed protein product [Nezara viridula]|uniref:Uncharacterized protein n=1 Tax=Nezara viridula TaxID=85310 RepID=A0A9P0E9Q1_NEZVI|nr:unnamed protein product [Nezara viridula]